MRNRQRTGSSDEAARTIAVPAARKVQLIPTKVGSELVIYDEARHHIHHLNRSATSVLQYCDGRRTVPELAQLAHPTLAAGRGEALVRLALPELETANLLDQRLHPALHVPTSGRRDLLRRLGAAALAPVVISMTAAEASANQSPIAPSGDPNGTLCETSSTCSSGCCHQFGSTCVDPNQDGIPQPCK